jgi:hypothetical protein
MQIRMIISALSEHFGRALMRYAFAGQQNSPRGLPQYLAAQPHMTAKYSPIEIPNPVSCGNNAAKTYCYVIRATL